jgi:hypothetical protein
MTSCAATAAQGAALREAGAGRRAGERCDGRVAARREIQLKNASDVRGRKRG